MTLRRFLNTYVKDCLLTKNSVSTYVIYISAILKLEISII